MSVYVLLTVIKCVLLVSVLAQHLHLISCSVRALHQGVAGATAGSGTQGTGEDPASHSWSIWPGGPGQNRGGYQVKHALTCPQRSQQAGLASQTLDKQIWRPRLANREWAPPLIAQPMGLCLLRCFVCLPLLFAFNNWLRQYFYLLISLPVKKCAIMRWIIKLLSHNTIPIHFCLVVSTIDSTTLRKTWILLWRRRLRVLVRWSCCTSTAK